MKMESTHCTSADFKFRKVKGLTVADADTVQEVVGLQH